MTTTDLNGMMAAADLADRTTRLVLADALRDAGRDGEAGLLAGEQKVLFVGEEVRPVHVWTVQMHCEGSAGETETVEATSLEDAADAAEELTREWIVSGEWGYEGASIRGWWRIVTDDEGGDVPDGMTMREGNVTVEIEPDDEE